MAEVNLVMTPSATTQDGGKGPRLDWSWLAIFVLSPPGGWTLPKQIDTDHVLNGGEVPDGITIDYPPEAEATVWPTVRRSLALLSTDGGTCNRRLR